MRKPSILVPVILGAAAGLAAAIIGDVAVFAALSVLGLSLLATDS